MNATTKHCELRRPAAVGRRPQWRKRPMLATGVALICLGLLATICCGSQAFTADDALLLPPPDRILPAKQNAASHATAERKPVVTHLPKRANFGRERVSPEARHVADWIVDTNDNLAMPFVIVDKKAAKVFVFHADGRLRGAAPALLGLAKGDDSVPGIGDRKLSTIRPEERTTPSGRFVASLERNSRGVEILWVDYLAAISMHRVITLKPRERRLQRLSTPSALDNRITYGCINVPRKFFDRVVRPAFNLTYGIVYVLPETRSARELFALPELFDSAE